MVRLTVFYNMVAPFGTMYGNKTFCDFLLSFVIIWTYAVKVLPQNITSHYDICSELKSILCICDFCDFGVTICYHCEKCPIVLKIYKT